VFAVREACLRVQHSMRAVCDVPGESPERSEILKHVKA
jgi:hypothetical protein